ncbi:MAG: pyruvate dehydrogenase (acetyl-transferring) E1 component subunit alpha [Trueperaceae bacterium]
MELVRYVLPSGEAPEELPLTREELLHGYRALVRARVFDERAIVLQRQGKLGVYPPYRGQEAAQVGASLALEPEDWLVPSYRESAAALTHGLAMHQVVLYWRAHPAGWRFPDDARVLPFAIPIATQLPHAVGIAHAGTYQERRWVAMTFIGDGGTSEGDFHEALNFAAVFDAPAVFVVQNNGWAISVPTERQMRNPRVADRAAGYGIPGVVVDGNDLVAMWTVARQAVERARAGEGPTLIEAVTYRLAPHTTSDDPSRYRDEDEAKQREAEEPVRRLRTLLEDRGWWDDDQEEGLVGEIVAEVAEAVRLADEAPEPTPESIVEHVFAAMGPDQRAAWEVLRAR